MDFLLLLYMLTYKYLKYKNKYIKKKNIDNDKLNLLNNNDNVKLNLIGGDLPPDIQLFNLFTNLKCWEPNFENDYQESQHDIFLLIEKLIKTDIPQSTQLLSIKPSIQQLSVTSFDIEQYATAELIKDKERHTTMSREDKDKERSLRRQATISNLEVTKDNEKYKLLLYEKLYNLLITILPYYEKGNDCNLNSNVESKCNNFAITQDNKLIIISFRGEGYNSKEKIKNSYNYMTLEFEKTYFRYSMTILCRLLVAKKFFLLKLLITSMNEGKKIYLTGHSLGGISALYLHIILTFLFKYENLETYIFGGFPIIPIHLKNDLRNLYYIMHMCDPVNEYNPIDRLLTNSIENIIYLTNSRMIFENKLAYLNYTKLANSQYNLKSKISIYYDSKFKTIEKNYIFHTYDAYSYEMHTAFHNYYNYYDINKNIDRRNNIIFIKIYNYFIMTRIGTIRNNKKNIEDSKKNIDELLKCTNSANIKLFKYSDTDIKLMNITDDIISMLCTIHKDIEKLILDDIEKMTTIKKQVTAIEKESEESSTSIIINYDSSNQNEENQKIKDESLEKNDKNVKEKMNKCLMKIEYINQKSKYFTNSLFIIDRLINNDSLIKNKKNHNNIIRNGVENMEKLSTWSTWLQYVADEASVMFYRGAEDITKFFNIADFVERTTKFINSMRKKYA